MLDDDRRLAHQRSPRQWDRARSIALTDGYQLAFLIAAGLTFSGMVAAPTLLRGRPEGVVRPASQGA